MAQDYSARWDLRDFPCWRADESGDDTDGLREAFANLHLPPNCRGKGEVYEEWVDKASSLQRWLPLVCRGWGVTLWPAAVGGIVSPSGGALRVNAAKNRLLSSHRDGSRPDS
jgi:hypothetical protein